MQKSYNILNVKHSKYYTAGVPRERLKNVQKNGTRKERTVDLKVRKKLLESRQQNGNSLNCLICDILCTCNLLHSFLQ